MKKSVADSSNPVQVLLRNTKKDLPWLERFIRNNKDVAGLESTTG